MGSTAKQMLTGQQTPASAVARTVLDGIAADRNWGAALLVEEVTRIPLEGSILFAQVAQVAQLVAFGTVDVVDEFRRSGSGSLKEANTQELDTNRLREGRTQALRLCKEQNWVQSHTQSFGRS